MSVREPSWWRPRVVAEIRPFDATDEREEVVLPEAEGMTAARRIRVMLPSGKILRCSGSIMIHFSRLLQRRVPDLMTGVLHLECQPASSLDDETVIGFFSLLHQCALRKPFNIPKPERSNYTLWGFLQHALDLVGLSDLGPKAVRGQLPTNLSPKEVFLGTGLQELRGIDDQQLRREFAKYLTSLPALKFREFLSTENRATLLEALHPEDLFAVAYSRWRQPLVHNRQVQTRETQYLPGVTAANSDRASDQQREIILSGARDLPDFLRLQIVVNGKFTVTCDASRIESMSIVVRESLALSGQGSHQVPGQVAIAMAGAVSEHAIRAAFELIFNWRRRPPPRVASEPLLTILCFVSIVDSLKIRHPVGSQALDKEARVRLWNEVPFDHLWEWIAVTRLQSMQADRPPTVGNTVTTAEVRKLLRTHNEAQTLASRLSRQAEFISALGIDELLDLLYDEPN